MQNYFPNSAYGYPSTPQYSPEYFQSQTHSFYPPQSPTNNSFNHQYNQGWHNFSDPSWQYEWCGAPYDQYGYNPSPLHYRTPYQYPQAGYSPGFEEKVLSLLQRIEDNEARSPPLLASSPSFEEKVLSLVKKIEDSEAPQLTSSPIFLAPKPIEYNLIAEDPREINSFEQDEGFHDLVGGIKLENMIDSDSEGYGGENEVDDTLSFQQESEGSNFLGHPLEPSLTSCDFPVDSPPHLSAPSPFEDTEPDCSTPKAVETINVTSFVLYPYEDPFAVHLLERSSHRNWEEYHVLCHVVFPHGIPEAHGPHMDRRKRWRLIGEYLNANALVPRSNVHRSRVAESLWSRKNGPYEVIKVF